MSDVGTAQRPDSPARPEAEKSGRREAARPANRRRRRFRDPSPAERRKTRPAACMDIHRRPEIR
jgi:hypothetical protein